MRQVPVRAVKMVSQIRAAFATLFPARAEHEVIDDQLTMTLEQIGQRLFSVRSFEGILLLDLDHRELAPRRTKRIALPSELFFSRQQILPRDQPLSFRYDFCLFICYFHFFLLQFRLFDVFDWLKKNSRHRKRRRPAGLTRTASNRCHVCDMCRTHRISRLILFAVDTFQTLATRDSCDPMGARLMSTHLLAG